MITPDLHSGIRSRAGRAAPAESRILEASSKSTATSAIGRAGEFQDLYCEMTARGMREDMARLTLACKFAAITLRLRKAGDHYDPAKLTV